MKQFVSRLVMVALRSFLTKAMRATLHDSFPADQLTPQIRAAWQHYGVLARKLPVEVDTVAFDVHRCPAANYFASQGLSESCVSAFCNLDYPLADKWGVTLERPQTLAGGADFCDFRFRQLPQKER